MNFEFIPLLLRQSGLRGTMGAIAVALGLLFWRKRHLARSGRWPDQADARRGSEMFAGLGQAARLQGLEIFGAHFGTGRGAVVGPGTLPALRHG